MYPTPKTQTNIRRFLPVCASVILASHGAWGQATAPTSSSTSSQAENEETIILSPFEVDASNDIGYYAENTLAGSRLNTNVGDLAASITVVTKQQLEDTGALDLNDVFLYESNTEGAGTYTPVALNRNNITDNIGGWSGDDGSPFGIATANRVRGLGRVDTAQNNHPTIARMAFDTYNTNSVEISRGPNSMLFGTGSPAGIVNQSSSEAVLNQRHTTISARFGSYDAWRASISTNIPIGDKLAVYLAALYDERGFQRKPSSDTYRRQYAALTFQPFTKTKLTASIENYDNYNNRPNYLPPQDLVTPWLEAGRPGFNPTTQLITFQDTGAVTQPYLNSTRDARYVAGVTASNDGQLNGTTSPFFIPGIQFSTRNTMYIDDGELVNFWAGITTAGSTTTTLPADATRTQAQRLLAATRLTQSRGFITPIPDASTGATGYQTWLPVHVTDQSIYDWEKYNASGANYGTQKGKTYNIELQQEILPNLHFSAGWFRQEFDEWNHYGLGQANQAPRLYVDTNTHLLNGSPNPYFGSPYALDWQADTFFRPETNDNMRALLAYEFDFSKRDGWTRWLGKHRLMGLVSRQEQWTNNLRYRFSNDGGDARFLPNTATSPPGNYSWAGGAAVQRIYYLGQNTEGTVERGIKVFGTPGFGGPESATFDYYDWVTGGFAQTEMHQGANLFYAGGNYGVATRDTDSKNIAWQAYLWDERIIPTIGWRSDDLELAQYSGRTADGSRGLTNQDFYTNGFGNPGFWNNLGTPRTFSGDTKTRGVVMRPFKGWDSIETSARNGSFFAQLLNGLQFHYNESDNFNAPPGLQVDFFNRPLPAPSGTGKDYGLGVTLFDNKLVLRLNWYESNNQFAPSSAANTVVGRSQRIDTASGRRWAEYVVRIQSGQDPRTDLEFHNNTMYPLSQAQQDQITALQWGSFEFRDYLWPDSATYNGTIASTESNSSEGMEFSMIYNPMRNWNIKLTIGQQKAEYSDAGGEVTEWLNFRRPQWEALTASGVIASTGIDLSQPMVKANGNLLYLGSFWNGYGFTQGATFDDASSNTTGAVNTPATSFTGIVDALYFPMLALEGTSSPSLREWSSSLITNYSFQEGRWKGYSIGGSVRWQDKAVAGYYGLEDPTTYARPNATTANIVFPDLDRPLFAPAETNVDLWASYTTRIMNDKVRLKVQLNIRDAFESGGLQVIGYNPDGSEAQYRIKDPRQWFITTTFDF